MDWVQTSGWLLLAFVLVATVVHTVIIRLMAKSIEPRVLFKDIESGKCYPVRNLDDVLKLKFVQQWEKIPAFSHFALASQNTVLVACAKLPRGACYPIGAFSVPVLFDLPQWKPSEHVLKNHTLDKE